MAWKKGQSGNPKGRPPALADVNSRLREVRDLARANATAAIQRILEITRSKDEPTALRASGELLRWAYGDPAKVEPDAQPGDQALAQMPREDRIAFLEAALAHERGEEAKVVALPSLALLPPQKPA